MYVRSEHTVAIQNLKADHEDRIEALRYTMKKQLDEEQKKGDDLAKVLYLLEARHTNSNLIFWLGVLDMLGFKFSPPHGVVKWYIYWRSSISRIAQNPTPTSLLDPCARKIPAKFSVRQERLTCGKSYTVSA